MVDWLIGMLGAGRVDGGDEIDGAGDAIFGANGAAQCGGLAAKGLVGSEPAHGCYQGVAGYLAVGNGRRSGPQRGDAVAPRIADETLAG